MMSQTRKPTRWIIDQLLIPSLLAGSVFVSTTAIAADEAEILYWVAPMDANYRRDKPGKSPMGMDLVAVYADDASGGSSITVSAAMVQNLGIRTELAERSRLWRGIDTVGYVTYDESMSSHVHLRTSGWVEDLNIDTEGDRVKQGDRLFNLYSPELVNAQEEFITALSSKNKKLTQASAERLKALGVGDEQIKQLRKTRSVQQHIAMYAHHDGVVTSLMVREGMYIEPSTKVISLRDLSSVWVLAEVYERQTEWVKTGQTAEVTLSYIPGKTWQGVVDYIYPGLDAKTRTLKVRLRFDNPDETLKPNMYANVKIYGGAKQDVLTVPLDALIRSGRHNRLIVELEQQDDGHQFEVREVRAGIESGDYVEILEGLQAGERVVVSGQFLLDSEASMRGSLKRLSSNTGEM